MDHLWLCCAAKEIFPLGARFPWEFQHSNSDCSLGIVRAFHFSGATGCASGDAGLGQTQDSSGLPVPIRGKVALCSIPPPKKVISLRPSSSGRAQHYIPEQQHLRL